MSSTTSTNTPGPGNSFLNRHDHGPFGPRLGVAGVGYHHSSAEDAWGRTLRFSEPHLRAG